MQKIILDFILKKFLTEGFIKKLIPLLIDTVFKKIIEYFGKKKKDKPKEDKKSTVGHVPSK